MDLRRLKYFVAVAEKLNFTAAARDLGMAQPPLSVQIRKLEADIGCPLFERQNRRIQLTVAGRTLLKQARESLQKLEETVLRIQDEGAGREGEIRLAIGSALSERLTKRLRKFIRKNRGLRWKIYGAETNPATMPAVDAWIDHCAASELPPGAVPLEEASLQVAVSPKHRLAGRPEGRFTDLMGENLLVSPQRSEVDRLVIDKMQAGGLPLSIIAVDAPLSIRRWQASLGLGIATCTSGDQDGTDAVRLTLLDFPDPIVTTIRSDPSGQALALPGLIDALRSV